MLQFLLPMVKAAIINRVTKQIKGAIMEKVNPEGEKVFWRSKKWLTAFLGVAIPLLNHFFGWEMSPETIWTILGPIMAYVGGQGLADFGKSKG